MQICCKFDFDSVPAFKKATTKLMGFLKHRKIRSLTPRNVGGKPGLIKAFTNEPVEIF